MKQEDEQDTLSPEQKSSGEAGRETAKWLGGYMRVVQAGWREEGRGVRGEGRGDGKGSHPTVVGSAGLLCRVTVQRTSQLVPCPSPLNHSCNHRADPKL